MADAVATQILFQGDKQVIMKFTNASDGTGETNVTKVDVSTLTPYQQKPCVAVQIDKVYAMTHGMELRMLWGASTNVTIMSIPQQVAQTFDFNEFGGLDNNAGAGKTGNILFTTLDASAGDFYTIILVMRKLY